MNKSAVSRPVARMVSPAGSVGASALRQRSPPAIRTHIRLRVEVWPSDAKRRMARRTAA